MVVRRAVKAGRWHYVFMSTLMASASALPVHAADSGSATAVQEVIITANKRSESLQKVPISVQALTPKILSEQHVSSFDDYAKLLPSVSFQSFGPGQSQPYFRGITSGADGLHSGSAPGTGVYVDETPVTTIGNAVDLHMYDIARVEALSGPQGTLFGASSLSGTLRVITNQPDVTKFSGAFDLQGDTYVGHGAGGVAEGYVNIPIIEDKVAIRLVGFDEHDGGYIDNIPKTRQFTTTGGATLNESNSKYVKNNYNYTDTYGGRAALKIDLNDSWTITPSVIYQNQDAEGNFLYNPQRGDLKTSDFAPEYNKDSWYQSALTIKGKIGDWDVLYSGGYFARTVNNASDYSYYAVAYNANGSSSYVTFPNGHGGYLDPDQQFHGKDQYTKESHEFRINSPTQYRLRAVVGAFYERQFDRIAADYIVPGLAATGDSRSVKVSDGFADAGDDIYYTRIDRIDRDFALFTEGYLDIFSNLTATVGFRYFSANNSLTGRSGFESGLQYLARDVSEYGETHKINLSWKIDPQRMVYATYSTGFRPGGDNRKDVVNGLAIPPYGPDTITNYEIGAKTTWLDGRLRLNGAIFDEEWHNIQFTLSPPGFQGVSLLYNVGYARSKGVEGDLVFHPDEHWTFSSTGTYLNANITKTFCESAGSTNCAYSGSELPIQPKYKVSATARYEFNYLEYRNFLQGSMSTQGNTRSALLSEDAATLGPTKGFTTFDLSAGTARKNWTFEVFVQNLLDRRGILGVNTDCSITYCGPYPLKYPTKPRFVGVKIGATY
jgi:outer membrane receptor protein involved in Fe transport